MSDNEKNKISKKKKRNLIIVLVVLLIAFIGYGVSIPSTSQKREKKIISYLEKKYNSKFEIIGMTSSGEHVILDEISCDGSTFCPEIKDKGVHYYRYKVLSLDDKVTFEVTYLDKRLIDEITETTTYYSLTQTDTILKEMNDYITKVMKNNNSKISSQSISFEFNEKFDETYNSDYRKKLEKISKYVKQKRALDKDLDILVYFSYSDNILIAFGYDELLITKRSKKKFEDAEGTDISTGEYMKVYHSLDEYLNRNRK